MKSVIDTSASSPSAPAPADQAREGARRRASDSVRMSPMRRFFYEWLLMAALLPAVLMWLSTQDGLWHANALAHDLMLTQGDGAAPNADIVVVSLDDPCPAPDSSCAPLARRYQNALTHLQAQQPRAILVDTGPLNAHEVQALGQFATAGTGRTPVFTTTHNGTDNPAWAEPDRDGLTRSVRTRHWTQHGWAPHPAAAALGIPTAPEHLPEHIDLRWHATPDVAYPTLSYAALLLGLHPATAVQGKLVVVGPRSSAAAAPPWLARVGSAIRTLPSTNAQAQVLDNLAQRHWVTPSPPALQWLWASLPVWLAMLLVRRWPERLAQLLLGTAGLAVLIGWYLLLAHRVSLPVATPLAGLLLFQLLWNWRRGVAIGQVFRRRIERLEAVLAQAPSDHDPRAIPAPRPRKERARPQVEMLDDNLDRLEAHHQIQRRTQQQRDRWLAFLSHDLRAPQSNILSLLELHEAGVEGMDDKRLFSGVRVQVDRTLRLAEGFVDLLRAESDHLNLRHCTLESLSTEAVDRCWPQAQAQQVRIVQRGTEDGLGPLQGDPELLTRAMVNILSNAVRHSEAGDTVEVKLVHDADKQQVVWSVRDQGPGMTTEQLGALMQALDSHTWVRPRHVPGAGRGHGLGLGLLVARTVVSRHLGELHATATPAQGCCFSIVLPADAPPPPPQQRSLLGQAWLPLKPKNPPTATRALQA